MKKIPLLILAGLVCHSLSIFTPTTIRAQDDSLEQIGLSIVPAIVDVPLSPGVNKDFTITATNITNQPLPILVGVRPLVPIDKPTDNLLAERYDATAWIDFESNQLLLEAKESKVVSFTVSPPVEGGPGGHYVQIVFRVLTPFDETEQSSTKISPELTATVLFTVPGEIEESIEISANPVSWLSFSPQKRFEVTVANTGNSHILINPSTVILDSFFNDDSAVASLTGQSKLLLPHTESTIPFYWNADRSGIFNFQTSIKFGSPAQTSSLLSPKFVVLPAWWVIIASITTMLAIGLMSWRTIKRKLFTKPFTLSSGDSRDWSFGKLKPHELDQLAKDRAAKDKSKR